MKFLELIRICENRKFSSIFVPSILKKMKRIIITSLLCLIYCQVFVPNSIAESTSNTASTNVKEIIVIFKTHFDIGFTHRVDDIIRFYRTEMLDQAFQVMEQMEDRPKEERLSWTLPGWVTSKILEDFPGQTIERKKKVDQAFRSGTIITHALPFTLESEACGLEDMVRGLGFASHVTRKYNLPLPRSGKQTDVPSHPGALATVLANSDIHFLHIGTNSPSSHVQTPELFWWEGPDQSRILTFYSPTYGTATSQFFPRDQFLPVMNTGYEKMVGNNLLPPEDWPYRVWPAIIVTLDNVGPPTAQQVKSLIDEVKQHIPGVHVRMGTMDDFYEAIMKEKPELPVVKNEMPDTWIHGIMCDPRGVRMMREVQQLLPATEALHTQLQSWGVQVPVISKHVSDAYNNMALYGEHTWGGWTRIEKFGQAFKEIPVDTYADLEASWEDNSNYVRKAHRLTHQMNQTNLEQLAKTVNHKSPAFLVYNPLPWVRSGIVEINNRKVYVKDIPSCGYRTFQIKEDRPVTTKATASSIENDFFKIVFDTNKGVIASLVDKRSGREWVDLQANQGLGQYMNERFTLEQTMEYTSSYQKAGLKEDLHPGIFKPGMISEKVVPYRAASPSHLFAFNPSSLDISSNIASQVSQSLGSPIYFSGCS